MNLSHLIDLALLFYFLILIAALYGFCFMSWWQKKMPDGGSEMYVCIKLFFVALSINYFFNIIARCSFLVNPLTVIDEPYEFIITKWWWNLRVVPSAIIIYTIIYKLTRRACNTIRNNKIIEMIEERRKVRRREEDRKLNHNGQGR